MGYTASDAREIYRKNLNGLYLPIYDSLCNFLSQDWKPVSGYRTIQEQDKLYQQGRLTEGKIVTRANGGESAHNYGCASDWYPFDDNGHPCFDVKDKRWKDYEYACAKAGAKWGGIWGDFGHNELALNVSWRSVYTAFRQQGPLEGYHYIKENRV